MKLKHYIYLSIIVFILIFIGYRIFLKSEKVKSVVISRQKLTTLVYASGSVAAESLATMRAEVAGRVTEVKVKEGEIVRKGAVLMKIDQTDLQLKVDQAEVDIQSAKIDAEDKQRQFARIEKLYSENSVTRKEFDIAKRDMDMASTALQKAKLALAKDKENLAKSSIYAPFDCVILAGTIKVGDYVQVNSECFRIVVPGSQLVEAEIDEQDVDKVSLHQRCIVAFDAFPQKKLEGLVDRIVPETDKNTKTTKVFIKLLTLPKNLVLGMTATVNIVIGEKENCLVIPRSCLLQKKQKQSVFIIEAGKLKEVTVETTIGEGKYVELLTGIPIGTVVVDEPKADYNSGLKVTPVTQ